MKRYSQLHLAVIAFIVWSQGKSIMATGMDDTDGVVMDEVSLIQTGIIKSRSNSEHTIAKDESCAPMVDHGTYFTLSVRVGTPGESFDIIADTGSNAMIIPDCSCTPFGGCGLGSACFHTKRSSSFMREPIQENGIDMARLATLGYGSGDITCEIATDSVSVAGIGAVMKRGLYLMQDRKALKIDGEFGGILGLGLPESTLGEGNVVFMKNADVPRYSLCFNKESDGALRLRVPPLENAMGNMGQVHWGLDLQGVTVGETSLNSLQSCDPVDPTNMKEGMLSACGAIPDSGTTLMMGPKDHIAKILEAICNNWKKCTDAAKENPETTKDMLVHSILEDCSNWIDKEGGLDGLPALTFKIAGKEGIPQNVRIGPDAYVFKTTSDMVQVVRQNIWGWKIDLPVAYGRGLTCTPAFGSHDYNTKSNGPIWILGSPLFTANTVSYDISQTPSAMQIKSEPCNACTEYALYSKKLKPSDRLREVKDIRWPSVDTSKEM